MTESKSSVSVIKPFDFNGSKVEVQIDENGKEWFNGNDVLNCLGYGKSSWRNAIADHCRKDGVSIRHVIDSLGRQQKANFVNEPNLYRLVVKSKLPAAEDFEKWVFETVLPSIRRTGSYSLKPKQEETVPRFHYDTLAEQHKELQYLYRKWYRRMYRITPTDAQEAQFVIFINEACLGERTFTRQHLTYKGAYRVMAGYQILINQLKKGYRDLDKFESLFYEQHGVSKEQYLLRPKQEEVKSIVA